MTIRIIPDEYEYFCAFLEENCGIFLQKNKEYLVNSRLSRLCVRNNINTLKELVDKAKKDLTKTLLVQIVESMTTHETLWFRDIYPYEMLKNTILKEMIQSGKNKIRIWSAACSTGQEPFSIGMTIDELTKSFVVKCKKENFEILASDISESALNTAKKGEYGGLAFSRGLPVEMKMRYFKSITQENSILIGDMWKIKDEILNMVEFRQYNLQDSYFPLGKFDIIFCRNVLIYFADDMKKEILKKFHQILNPKGYLFLGASETILGHSTDYSAHYESGGIVYVKK